MSPAQIDLSKLRVLVVEDNKINQLLTKNMLRKFGIVHIDESHNGKAALEKLSSVVFDLVLMDIQLPQLNGFETTRRIREHQNSLIASIPVVALAGDSHEDEKKKAVQSGMNGYLAKPFTPEELYSVILSLASHSKISRQTDSKNDLSKKIKLPGVSLHRSFNDLQFLDKYTGGDETITVRLIETFLKDVPDAIEEMEKSIPGKNWKEVHAVSHRIKSCLAIFELNELKKILVRIEESSKHQVNTEHIPSLFIDFKNGCQPAIRNLKDALSKRKNT